ncbi:MAG TPA: hypothetical protein VGK67_30860 [Myxococcales bacterium]|jgi:MYXO-CTERM domain-containing protein
MHRRHQLLLPGLALAITFLVFPAVASAQCGTNAIWCNDTVCCNTTYPICCNGSSSGVGDPCGKTQLDCNCLLDGKDVCGGGCIPKGSVCCSGGSYCPSGTTCDSRCGCLPTGTTCCSDGTYCQEGKQCNCGGCTDPGVVCCADGTTCPQGNECGCGGCAEPGATCCGNGTYCQAGQSCCGSGCASTGSVCCGAFSCNSGQACCGNGCMPSGSVCCSSGYCPQGTSCDGSMCRGSGQSYSGYTCPTGYPNLCSTATPFCCPSGTSCGNNECILNYQPPPNGSETPGRGSTPGPTGKPSPSGNASDPNSGLKPAELKWGCSTGPGGTSWVALAALACALGLRRRRARVSAVVVAAAVALSAPAQAANATATPCPAGQERNEDTFGNCCWIDQAWSKARQACVGIPRCPANLRADGETCVFNCEPGKTITDETAGNCCWPGQVWSKSRARCVGIPTCTVGRVASGEECVVQGAAAPAAAPAPAPVAQPVAPAQPAAAAPLPIAPPPPPPQPVLMQPVATTTAAAPQPLMPPPPGAQPAVGPVPRSADEPPPYEPVYGKNGVKAPAPAQTVAAPEEKKSYAGLRWMGEVSFAFDATSKYPGAVLHLDIPFGTKHIVAFGIGAGIFGQVEGGGDDKLLVFPFPIRLSYRFPVLETGLQIIPLIEGVPNLLKLGKQEKWGGKVGGGLILHYSRVSSGPGVNLGCEVLGVDGTVVLTTLGMTF